MTRRRPGQGRPRTARSTPGARGLNGYEEFHPNSFDATTGRSVFRTLRIGRARALLFPGRQLSPHGCILVEKLEIQTHRGRYGWILQETSPRQSEENLPPRTPQGPANEPSHLLVSVCRYQENLDDI